ncbi:MAG: acyl-CoA synthetase, partial [Ignavibacterium sp.]
GLRINLDEVQKLVENKFAVTIACIGNDSKIKIFLESEPNGLAEKIKELICKHFQLNHSVVNIIYLDKIPINSSGKFDYSKLIID